MIEVNRSARAPLFFLALCLVLGVNTLHSAEVALLPGDGATGPAIGTQLTPVIAAGADGYLAAWREFRSSPHSGPPATAQGRGVDIYAQRLDGSGAPVGSPIPIAIGFGDQLAPQVAWNGENWLVAWETPCECWSYSSQVQAVRVSPSGEVLDAEPIIVHTNASEWFRMTANGSEWLVVLDSLRGVRVSSTGELVNPGGTQMALRETTGRHAIVSAQGEYLLVWDGWGLAEGRRFTADLQPIGDSFPVRSTYIASSGEDYFVVWDEQSTYWDDYVLGRSYSIEGLPGPTLTLAGSGEALPLANPGQLAVGWANGNWWAGWVESARGVVFSRVSTTGTVLDFGGVAVDPTSSGYFPMSTPAITGRPAGGAQFVWQDKRADGGFYDILTAGVDAAGASGPTAAVSTSARAQQIVDFAVGDTEVLAAFRSDLSGDHTVVAQRLDLLGNPIDLEPFVIATDVDAGTGVGVGFDGTRYMVAWETDGQVYGRRVLPSGTVVDFAPIAILGGEGVDVAGMDGLFACVSTQQTIGEHIWQPFAARVDGPTGTVLDPAAVLIGGSFARAPRIIAFGGRWLATWQENFTHDNPAAEAKAAFFEADGSTAGDFVYGFGGQPDVAGSGNRALFVWRTGTPGFDNDIVGRFMTADGTLAPDTLTIWQHEEDISKPAVGWNGSEFVVVWEDMRNALNYFDERRQIYGARVEVDGTVVDPDGFAFGDRAELEVDPAVVGVAGRTLIAASSFRNEPEFGNYRIAYELLGDPATGNRQPSAVLDVAPSQGDAPLPVMLDGAGSSDPDGSVVFYEWDFGDGATSTLQTPSHTYATPANYLAQLTVTDDLGARTSNVDRVDVEPVNLPPIAVPASDVTSGEPPLAVVFYARDSYDPDTGIQNWEWDFGDGWDYWGSTAYHTFNSIGSYTVTLTVHDFRGASGSETMTITVGNPNESPTAEVLCSPLAGPAPLDIGFNGLGSSDPDGTVVAYEWNFGDGNTASGATPNHLYATPGQYTATLTVTDDDGATDVTQATVDVMPQSQSNQTVGTVPDRFSPTEQPLQLSKALAGASIRLIWDDSCSPTDNDYAVYSGPIGDFSQRAPIACSTGGATSTTLPASGESVFYLIVATNGEYEGSHGSDSTGTPRVGGAVQCLPTAFDLGCQ